MAYYVQPGYPNKKGRGLQDLPSIIKMFLDARNQAQQTQMQKRQLTMEEALSQARIKDYEARANQPQTQKNPLTRTLNGDLYQLNQDTGQWDKVVDTEQQIHTPHYKAQILGQLMTGSPYSPLGIPMETLETAEDYTAFATNKFGPDWVETVPEALGILNKKFPNEFPVPKTEKPAEPKPETKSARQNLSSKTLQTMSLDELKKLRDTVKTKNAEVFPNRQNQLTWEKLDEELSSYTDKLSDEEKSELMNLMIEADADREGDMSELLKFLNKVKIKYGKK